MLINQWKSISQIGILFNQEPFNLLWLVTIVLLAIIERFDLWQSFKKDIYNFKSYLLVPACVYSKWCQKDQIIM